MTMLGGALVKEFKKRHAQSRKPLDRFVAIVNNAEWKTLPELKETFASADYVNDRIVFDIGGNKYRLVASVDFEEQLLVVESILTHERYNKEQI